MKKIIIMMLAALMLGTTSVVAVEAIGNEENGVAPCWVNMSSVDVRVNFSGTSGTASVTVDRIFGGTSLLEAALTVYRKVGNTWVYVTSTSGSSTRQLNLSVNFSGVNGNTYKAVADVTAYGPEGSESDSITEYADC